MKQEIVRQFRTDLRKLERVVTDYLRKDTCCHGVSIAQCHTLLAVEQLGQVSLNGLAHFTELDKSTLSRTVEGLVKNGMLSRTVAAEDRRMILISLTSAGQKICNEINQVNDLRFSKILAATHRNPAELVELFSALVEAMTKAQTMETTCNFTSQEEISKDGKQ